MSAPINNILRGHVLDRLATLPDESVHCVVTSPPYWGLRDYGVPPQEWPEVAYAPMPGLTPLTIPAASVCLGLEDDPTSFTAHLVAVFREVWRILRKDGTVWVNMGDSYAHTTNKIPPRPDHSGCSLFKTNAQASANAACGPSRITPAGLKPKDLTGQPWRLAFALQADGWWLRSEVIWAKPNPMPASAKDRPSVAHEQIFMITKSARYFYDGDAIREHAVCGDHPRNIDCTYTAPGQPEHRGLRKKSLKIPGGLDVGLGSHGAIHRQGRTERKYSFKRQVNEASRPTQRNPNHRESREDVFYCGSRNKRTVWTIATHPFPDAHFATFPPRLAETCIKAGCPAGGVVLDPFMGSGTVGLVAAKLGRRYLGVELNPQYADMAERRIRREAGLLLEVSA